MELQMSFEWLSTGRGDPFDFRITSAMKHLPALLERLPHPPPMGRGPYYGDTFATVPLIPARADWAISTEWLQMPSVMFEADTILVAGDKRLPRADLRAYKIEGDYMVGAGVTDTDIVVGVAPGADVKLKSGHLVVTSHHVSDSEVEIALREIVLDGLTTGLQTRPLRGRPNILHIHQPFNEAWESADNAGAKVTILALVVRIMKDCKI